MAEYKYNIIKDIKSKFLKIEGVQLEGRDFTFERINKHHASAMIVFNHDYTKMYLVKQFRFGSLEEMWEIPAGIIEHGLSAMETAVKEIKEETGYCEADIKSIKEINGGYVSPGYSSEYMHYFEVVIKEGAEPGEKELDEHELITEDGFYTYDEVMEKKAWRDLKTNYAILYWQTKK